MNHFHDGEKTIPDAEHGLYLHDRAPMQRAKKTQTLLKDSGITFPGNSNPKFPGGSPALNPTENLGSSPWINSTVFWNDLALRKHNGDLLLSCFAKLIILAIPIVMKFSRSTMTKVLKRALKLVQADKEFLKSLMGSMPRRMAAVRAAKGGYTKY